MHDTLEPGAAGEYYLAGSDFSLARERTVHSTLTQRHRTIGNWGQFRNGSAVPNCTAEQKVSRTVSFPLPELSEVAKNSAGPKLEIA
jgi:hypothetical protein